MSCSRLSHLCFEDAKITEFYAIALGKLSNDFIEQMLDYRLGCCARCIVALGNPVDKLFFCYC